MKSRIQVISSAMLLISLTSGSLGQTTLSYPASHPAAIASSQSQAVDSYSKDSECLKDETRPGCNANAGKQDKIPSPLRIEDEREALDLNHPERKAKKRAPAEPFLKPELPTEFQKFVAASVGEKLPIFGEALFDEPAGTFTPVEGIPVVSDYVIGPGDELTIRVWGNIELQSRVVVDRSGSIYLPRVGSFVVAGVKYSELQNWLRSAVGESFKNFDLAVTMGQLRSIQVKVLGYVRRPGVYTVSALSTLVSAVFASGGPSNRGSMRRIQLKRRGKNLAEIDLYDFLARGDESKDVPLLPGDIIYVPSIGPQVAIVGSVNNPAIYELAGETSLGTQIATAGGLTSVTDGGYAIVERIEGHATRKIEQLSLDATGFATVLQDGDVVRLFPISPRIENAITLRGNVARPGRYPWRAGMRIRDLIPDPELLLTREFWERHNAAAVEKRYGMSEESPKRNVPRDRPETVGRSSVQDDESEKLHSDVKRNAPEINWEYAVIQRVDKQTLVTALIPFNLSRAIRDGNEIDNVELQPGDTVTIFSQGDLAVPIEKRSKFVRLEGEFKAAGVYRVEPGETLRELIERAGGLTTKAYLFGLEFTRETARVEQQRSLDEMVRTIEADLQRKTLDRVQTHPEEQATVVANSQADQAILERLRRVKASGRVVIELSNTQSGVDAIPDIALEDGDRIYVPFEPSTVSVIGAVYNQNSFMYKSETRIREYLSLAGSGTRDADMKHMFVVRADGTVISRDRNSGFRKGSFESVKMLPGDMLVVPTQVEKGSFMRGLKDWSQVISQFALGAAAIYVLTN
jgi:polysaccharide biosynthesis/export protein